MAIVARPCRHGRSSRGTGQQSPRLRCARFNGLQSTRLAAGILLLLGSAWAQEGTENVDFAPLSVSRLRCVIGNNAGSGAHRSGYNGVFELWSPDQAVTPFVPAYAGLNLEHYFDARPRHEDSAVFFEPRRVSMDFARLSDTSTELHQPETPFFRAESRTTFELKEPYYIDMRFRLKVHAEPVGGFIGCFWASYLNGPLNKAIYFLGEGASLESPKWFQYCTLAHDRDSTVLPPQGDEGMTFHDGTRCLFNTLSPIRYAVPFFYGQVRNMILLYIFEPEAHIRFSHSPSGGGTTDSGDDTNPAWDFQFLVPRPEVGTEYGFRMRMAYMPWTGREAVLAEVRQFYEELKHD